MKAIPRVERDNADLEGRDAPTMRCLGIKINVTVMHHDDIEAARKLVPPKIEGYHTEVTDYVEAVIAPVAGLDVRRLA